MKSGKMEHEEEAQFAGGFSEQTQSDQAEPGTTSCADAEGQLAAAIIEAHGTERAAARALRKE